MRRSALAGLLIAAGAFMGPESAAAASNNQVTILYDAFGKPSNLKKDWGYSALIEYGGKKTIFDTGNNAEWFKHDAEALGINLKTLDFVALSHRHGDHTSGLSHVLSVIPMCQSIPRTRSRNSARPSFPALSPP